MEKSGEEAVKEQENNRLEMDLNEKNDSSNQNKKMKKQKKKENCLWVPRFGCVRSDDDVPAAKKPDIGGLDVEAGLNGKDQPPTHLIVTVNGIIGSAQNWRYAAKQFVKAYPTEVIVHCSDSNSSMLTLDGVDVMGKRLADEVISIVGRHSKLEKISFVGHSLGGVVARYAIAVLYQQDSTATGKIAGLEALNFITVATPHLGARGHKQIPVLCGFHAFEKAAVRASGVLRRTGEHLFLRDNENGKPPLLLQMADDSHGLSFISALQSFRRRVAYANTSFDYVVGWSSSSLRRLNELPKRRNLVRIANYRYVYVEDTSRSSSQRNVPSETITKASSRQRTSEMEEAMIRGLTRMTWERVDVDFSKTIQGLFAHTTIQVKTYCINSHGANVIQHMIDNFQL